MPERIFLGINIALAELIQTQEHIMKTLSFKALIATLAFAAIHSASAAPITYDFGYTGSIQSWLAPSNGTYQIAATGAQGGHGTIDNGPYVGGRGAQILGSFDFLAGQSFFLAVGGMGSSFANNYNGGGGGGSFFVDAAGNPLLIAGGGGGIRGSAGQNGFDASITEYGVRGVIAPTGVATVKATDLGQGGDVTSGSWGGGGAGFYSDGAVDFEGSGKSWANGLFGGDGSTDGAGCSSVGGFGGGGSGTGCGGGGGGGGYSGGDGGFLAGGGGSFNAGYDQQVFAGVGYGNGRIFITQFESQVPEPGSLALFGLGFLGLVARRKARKCKHD
jgi:hypothetical protein